MRRGESGEAQDKVFKRYEFSAKGKFLGRVRIWGASMGFLRVFCGALTTRLRGFCGVSLTWRVLLLFSVDVKCLFRYDRDMADQAECIMHSAQPAAEHRWSNRRTCTHATRGL